MEWLPMLSASLIIMSSVSIIFETVALKYYVTPNKNIGCSDDWSTCLTLQEYASQPNVYIASNTTFCFEPGSHTLNSSLNLENLSNFFFLGLPGHEKVKVLFGSFVSISWEKCWNIEISSITFILLGDFTYNIVFKQVQMVHLHNISVIGNGNIGCSAILSQQSAMRITNSNIVGIQGLFGAALTMSASNVTITGNNTFADNRAVSGGSIYSLESVVILNGTNLLKNNTAKYKYILYEVNIRCNYTGIVNLQTHKYYSEGGAIFCIESTLIINEYSTFTRNTADSFSGHGGAIAALEGRVSIHGSTLFHNNLAYQGGAMFLRGIGLQFHGNISLEDNSAAFGGAIHIYNTNVSFNTKHTSLVTVPNSITSESVTSYRQNAMITTFQGNKASQMGGAIESHSNNILIFTGTVVFIANSALNGGAIYSRQASKVILVPLLLNISFIMNHANDSGGALYFRDFQCLLGVIAPLECFFTIHGSSYATNNPVLHFIHNSAGSTGSSLYGGQLKKCRLYYRTNYSMDICGHQVCNYYSNDAFGFFMNISRIKNSYSAINISSQAEQIKACQDKEQFNNIGMLLYPGERFNITVIALDLTGSPVPTTLFVENQYTNDKFRLSPSSQSINRSCTTLFFQLYTVYENTSIEFKLYPENPCQSLAEGLSLKIHVMSCPIGFELSENHMCFCNRKLLKFTQKCNIDNSIVNIERKKNNFWISQVSSFIYFRNRVHRFYRTLTIHDSRCPLDYCIDRPINVSVSDPSVQCDFNRNGTLCGQCSKNFSLALGNLHCIPCDNNHTALIMFLAFIGVALIAVIFLLQLTVSVGTLNGLFFYANIIQANHQAFFPRATINFFTVFISWLNLDLGIESCFYNGMDIYAYSWIQFLFPFYIWFLVSCIILICHYSQSMAKQLRQNPVAVLATLLLMSFSKLLQAVIVPLSWTYLTYYSSTSEFHCIVWLYDAGIDFFKEPKHIILGLFAILILVVLVLPYISLLFFGHWLQGCTNLWILSWLNKLKPFMDAYHAPYKKHTRYWTGLLLLSRLGLFLTFAINANGSESVNLLAVSSATIALLAIKLLRVYENLHKDILESSFILNLAIFSVATFYIKEESKDDDSQLILSSISVGIAFITFIGILLFHINLVLKSSTIWKMRMLPFIQRSHLLSKITKDKNIKEDKDAAELQALPTSTEIDVDLREPLLESQTTT